MKFNSHSNKSLLKSTWYLIVLAIAIKTIFATVVLEMKCHKSARV